MPTVIIIAGPNGAGKTTFAREYLSAEDRHFEFVNADEIVSSLDDASDISAARIMLARIDNLAAVQLDFAIETTLANLSYAQKIPKWRNDGYIVSLAYLRLESVEQSIALRKRVAAGGHNIPVEVIRRRFGKSLDYFEKVYRPIVDEWYVWSSRDGAFSLYDSWDGRHASRT